MLIFKPHLQVVILIDHIILTCISKHSAFCLLPYKCKNDYIMKQALTALERQIRYAHNAGGLRRMLAAIVLQGCSLAPRPRTDTADGKRYALIQKTTSAGPNHDCIHILSLSRSSTSSMHYEWATVSDIIVYRIEAPGILSFFFYCFYFFFYYLNIDSLEYVHFSFFSIYGLYSFVFCSQRRLPRLGAESGRCSSASVS